ncbi:hypothetical protein AX14_004060 [Amanita brunnescens Koide BX004]|nr:hypothetical protein AX14_004060 [Amanita brunnescens Koide BX004]
MQDYVRAYCRCAFNLPGLLRPFIPVNDIDTFREILHETGAIISGSVALQYFDRKTFHPTDLDIYVNGNEQPRVVAWLLQCGLVESRRGEEDGSQSDTDDIDVVEGYRSGSSDVMRVENFKMEGTSKTVQVISTKRSPVFAVLQFHSCTPLPDKSYRFTYPNI